MPEPYANTRGIGLGLWEPRAIQGLQQDVPHALVLNAASIVFWVMRLITDLSGRLQNSDALSHARARVPVAAICLVIAPEPFPLRVDARPLIPTMLHRDLRWLL